MTLANRLCRPQKQNGTLTDVTRRFQFPDPSALPRLSSRALRQFSLSTSTGSRLDARGRGAILGVVTAASVIGGSLTACSSASSVETQPVEVPTAKVKLTNPGTGDLASVRWKDDGATQESTVVITQGFTQRGGNPGSDQTVEDTRLQLPLDSTVAGSNDLRGIHTQLGKPEGTNADLNADIATAQGFVAESTATSTGEVRELRMGAPEEATDTARVGVETALGQLGSIPIVFPTEDIGTDATWTVESAGDEQTAVTQKVTFTLLSRQGDMVNLKVDVKQVPTVQQLDTGGDTPLKVIEASTEMLSDRISVDLTMPLPVSGSIDFVTTVTYGDGTSNLRIEQQSHRGIEFR